MTDNNTKYTAKIIADYLGGEVKGDPETIVNGVCKIDQGKAGAITFLSNPKYEKFVYDTEASVVLVSREFSPRKEVKPTMVVVEDPYLALSRLMDFYDQSNIMASGISSNSTIHETAVIGEDAFVGEYSFVSENARIGKNVKLYPQVFIGRNVEIKDNTILYPGVKVYQNTIIGSECIIHAGTVIGSDGYGFAKRKDNSYRKIAQLGNVVIGNNVEIGSNCSIDRAGMGSTIIHDGVKISNLVVLAHNVEVGENTLIVAQTGIAGSSKVGKNCVIGGQVGIVGHISIADNVTIGAQSGVTNSIKEEGVSIWGVPAKNVIREKRLISVYNKLPELEKMVEDLQKELEELKKISNSH